MTERKWDTVSVCEDEGCGHCLRCLFQVAERERGDLDHLLTQMKQARDNWRHRSDIVQGQIDTARLDKQTAQAWARSAEKQIAGVRRDRDQAVTERGMYERVLQDVARDMGGKHWAAARNLLGARYAT